MTFIDSFIRERERERTGKNLVVFWGKEEEKKRGKEKRERKIISYRFW